MSFDAATDRRLNIPAGIGVKARPAWVKVPVADLRTNPDRAAGIDTQLVFGAPVLVFEKTGGFTLVQSKMDGYFGFVETSALKTGEPNSTHKVIVQRTFRYLSPDMKTPRKDLLSMGSAVCVIGQTETRGTQYALLNDGSAVIARHLTQIAEQADDPVAVAETLLHTPYLWGGASAFGIDCSGLVQLCLAMCGKQVLRDTDMQAATTGTEITKDELQRGDLVFWKGHVAFYRGDGTIIHANGHTMSVAIEGFEEAINRIAYLYGQPAIYRRP